jgi:glycosyltransferase involved in cell wall biosynthesis
MDADYSVVIPAFNAAGTLAETIASLRAQSMPPARIVVVDDGSTDATAQIARSSGNDIVVVSRANAGPGAASTYGMGLVDTPCLAFLDADDLWLPDKARVQLARLAENKEIDGLFARAKSFRHPNAANGEAHAFAANAIQDLWGRSALMMRTEKARQIGPMIDPPEYGGEMIDWIARGRDLGIRFEMLPQILVARRVHEASLSRRHTVRQGYLHVMRAALERRRTQAKQAPKIGRSQPR